MRRDSAYEPEWRVSLTDAEHARTQNGTVVSGVRRVSCDKERAGARALTLMTVVTLVCTTSIFCRWLLRQRVGECRRTIVSTTAESVSPGPVEEVRKDRECVSANPESVKDTRGSWS